MSREQVFNSLLCGIVFLFPIGMGTVAHWNTGLFILSLLVALLTVGRNWHAPAGTPWYLFAAFAIFFCLTALSLLNAEDLGAGLRRLEKLLFLLFSYPLCLALRRSHADIISPLLRGFVVSGFVMAPVAAYQIYYQGLNRAVGSYSWIIFGDTTMLAALVTLTALYAGRFAGAFRYVALLSFFCSSYAALLSGTRGAWLALPVVVVLLTMRYFSWRKIMLLFSLLVLFVLSISLNDHASRRFSKISSDLKAYQSGNVRTSLGTRLALYGHALEIWHEQPIVGIGVGNFRHKIASLVDERKTGLGRDWSHAHNVFLDALVSTGILGFLGLIGALFVLPVRYLWHAAVRVRTKSDNFPAIAGLVLLVSFAVFGLSETFLIHSSLVAVFAFLITVFIADVARIDETLNS